VPGFGGVCTGGDFSRILGGGVLGGILKTGILKGGYFRDRRFLGLFRGVPVLGLFWDLGFFRYRGFLWIGDFWGMAFLGIQAVFEHNPSFRHFKGYRGF
jgi:hypothetical protein